MTDVVVIGAGIVGAACAYYAAAAGLSVEVVDRGPLAGGQVFGSIGPYEYLTGMLHFTADPKHPDHGVICDLELAPITALSTSG